MKNEATRKYHKQGNKYDEYYTTLEEVEYIFNEVIKQDFTDKIIYCPFDGDNSAFVKYINEHKELGYKELWYTSDDFRNHEDLIDKCDVIISNPPFAEHRGHALYVKFLNKCFENCETLISVNPSPILKTFRKGGSMKKQYTMFRKSVDENYCEILDVDNEFDMCGLNDLIIIVLKRAEEHGIIYKDKKYDNYLDFCWAQVPPYLINFNNHITQFFHDNGCDNIRKHIHVTKHYVGFCLQDKKIEPPRDKLYCYFMKPNCSFNYLRYKNERYHYPLEYNEDDQRKKMSYVNFELDEYEKANNFLEYLNTKFILTCIELADKTDYSCTQKFNIMPWLDFSKLWTDKELFEMIGMEEPV